MKQNKTYSELLKKAVQARKRKAAWEAKKKQIAEEAIKKNENQ